MKENSLEIMDQLRGSLQGTFNQVAEFLPKLIMAFVILFIFWLVARAIKWALYNILKAVKFNDIADKVGINSKLKDAGLKSDATGWMAKLGYWAIMFTGYISFFDTLGLEVVSDLLNKVVSYIPQLIVGCILLIVGMFLADFIRDLVKAALKSGSFDNPNLVGNIAYGAVMFLTISIVMNQLNIGGDIVNTIVTAVLGGLSIAVAIAFGLGGRDWAAKTISKVSKMD